MTDRVIFELSSGWAFGYDDLQWIVFRRRNFRTQQGWKALAFIASNKGILRRVLKEMAIQPNPEAVDYLDAMPNTFKEWLHWHKTVQPKRWAA